MRNPSKRAIASFLFLSLLFFLFSGCTGLAGETVTSTPEPTAAATPSPTPKPTPTPTLAEYTGTVEHLFLHPLVTYPELAFDGDKMSDGFDDWFVTVDEYKKILQSLYDNGYILVDINSVYSRSANSAGKVVMRRNTLMLPEGKKPIILSFDDVNYYDYMRENGVVWKLIPDENGNIASLSYDSEGKEVISRDNDIITILDAFVEEHPDFSLNGAKGCIGLTGYEGILGYRTQAASPNRESEIEAVKPVIETLKETGWTFACHTWGHINMTNSSLERIQTDMGKWIDQVQSLVGETQVLLYPFGARVDEKNGAVFKYLQSCGFTIFCSVGTESYVNIHADSAAVCCDRMHPDGTTLRYGRKRYLRFYDAEEVLNLQVRPERSYDFSLD